MNTEKSSKGSIEIQFNIFIYAEDYGFSSNNAMDAFYTLSINLEKSVSSGHFYKYLIEYSQLFQNVIIPSAIQISRPIVTYLNTYTPTINPTKIVIPSPKPTSFPVSSFFDPNALISSSNTW